MELMAADTLVEGVDYIIGTGKAKAWREHDERVIVAFADESATWRMS